MPVIVLLAALLAFFFPQVGQYVTPSCINWLLGIVMLGMGMMLRWSDFRVVFARPKDVALGTLMQFAVMPLLGLGLSRLFHLSPELTVGVILVGCCPGGTASNVMAFLAGGDLALSVGLTAVSTLLAPLLTPLLVWLLVGQEVQVDVIAMLGSIVRVVILPIAIGLLVRRWASALCDRVARYLPAVSVAAIALIVVAVVAANQPRLLTSGLLIMLVVLLHNGMGFALGYGLASLCGLPRPKRITLSIEVGMQNSGLACSLAHQHFAQMAMAGVPGAVFSVWHNIAGALIAKLYRKLQKSS